MKKEKKYMEWYEEAPYPWIKIAISTEKKEDSNQNLYNQINAFTVSYIRNNL